MIRSPHIDEYNQGLTFKLAGSRSNAGAVITTRGKAIVTYAEPWEHRRIVDLLKACFGNVKKIGEISAWDKGKTTEKVTVVKWPRYGDGRDHELYILLRHGASLDELRSLGYKPEEEA